MGPISAVRICLSKYVTFSGRARRAEYWWFALFYIIGAIITRIVDTIVGTSFHTITPNGSSVSTGAGYISVIFFLAIVLPHISVTVRRLHDRGRSGWWYWLFLIPLVGAIWLLLWFCMRGTAGENRFGADPLADAPPMDAQAS